MGLAAGIIIHLKNVPKVKTDGLFLPPTPYQVAESGQSTIIAALNKKLLVRVCADRRMPLTSYTGL